MARDAIINDLFQSLIDMNRLLLPRTPLPLKNLPTRAQLGIMITLAQEGNPGIKELAQKFCLTSSAITQVVDGLVAQRLLTRKQDQKDRRKLHLALTEKGKKLLQRARKARLNALSKILEPLSDAELIQLHLLQAKIIQSASYD